MDTLSSWVLSIAGVICLSVILELIIPDGQMNKYVKSIFSFVIILVIISPIPKLINQVNFNNINFINDENITLQEEYLNEFNKSKIKTLNEDILTQINNAGYSNVYLKTYQKNTDNIEDIEIYVDLSNLVISKNNVNKNILDIKKEITQIITNNLGNIEVQYNE